MKIMDEGKLNLVVIRSIDSARAIKFYQLLGLTFEKHKHGKGLEHFSSTAGQATFEIYPKTPQAESTTGTRLGFQVFNVDLLVTQLQKEDITVLTKPSTSEWGRRAVVVDPDGHRVELIQI